MTAIVGIAEAGRVWIGADSQFSNPCQKCTGKQAKVFQRSGILFGVAGDSRIYQVLSWDFSIPPIEGELEQYLTGPFTRALRDCLKNSGCAVKENDREKHEAGFLLGVQGRLFTCYCDYSWLEPAWGYAAIGLGGDVATGALFATCGAAPRERIEIALRAADRHSVGVGSPFTILEMGGD